MLLDTAKDLYRTGQLMAAEAKLRQVLAAEPNNAEANFMLGTICTESGRLPEAERRLRSALESDPNWYEALEWLARAVGTAQRGQEAMELCERAIRIRPGEPAAYNALGLVYLTLRQPKDAIPAFRKATE